MKIKELVTDKIYRTFIIFIVAMLIALLFRIFEILTPNWYAITNGVIVIPYIIWTRVTDV